MTPGLAAILKIMSVYQALDYRLSHLEVQKLAYFLSVAGEPLGLNFDTYRYGPYSSNLPHVLKSMEGRFIKDYKDESRVSDINILPLALKEADTYLQQDSEAYARFKKVSALIQGFEFPYGMELLAAVHWVATHPPYPQTADDIITYVHKLGPSEREQPEARHIMKTLQRLQEHGWVSLE